MSLRERIASLMSRVRPELAELVDNTQAWPGASWSSETFRTDAGVLDGVSLLGDGTVSDMVWSRPAVTICGIDCPLVLGSAAAITPRASARLNLRVLPGMQAGEAAHALVSHLHAVAPWGVHVTADIEAPGSGFRGHPQLTSDHGLA